MVGSSVLQEDADRTAFDALLAQVATGDRAAFETLYRGAAPTMLGICLRVLPDRAEAEDVLQEVFVSVWHKAAQFDAHRAHGISWLCTMARNRAIDRLRTLPAQATRAPIDLAEATPDPDASPDARAETAADRARLDDCLDELDKQRQALIRTAFFEGASYAELARRSGSPLGSIKSWIRRSLQQLKACLER